MTGKNELISFKKMWTWLSGYPAHDRQYYMKNVAKLEEMWPHSCPLANSAGDDCDGCRSLWQSKRGTLCTDFDSPMFKWKNTSQERPDDRSFYASHIAVLAMNALRSAENEEADFPVSPSDLIRGQLHG